MFRRRVNPKTSKSEKRSRLVLYTAVLPSYRRACWTLLSETLGNDLVSFAGDAHLDPTVRSGIHRSQYRRVSNYRIGSLFLLQLGGWKQVVAAQSAILDLNPRSITAWLLLVTRLLLRRRTLLWGHLHPQDGPSTWTAPIRVTMRRLSSGVVLYGYDSVHLAKKELPRQAVWVAPNALYASTSITPTPGQHRSRVIYVGRLEEAKKVSLLIEGYAASSLPANGIRLTIVGHGQAEEALRELAQKEGVSGTCEFMGRVYDEENLRTYYAESLFSVSPGYAGLGLTQSIGFGVPVLVADREKHSPEIELMHSGAITFFPRDDVRALASALEEMALPIDDQTRSGWSSYVRCRYSAEAMANGLVAALLGSQQQMELTSCHYDQ